MAAMANHHDSEKSVFVLPTRICNDAEMLDVASSSLEKK